MSGLLGLDMLVYDTLVCNMLVYDMLASPELLRASERGQSRWILKPRKARKEFKASPNKKGETQC